MKDDGGFVAGYKALFEVVFKGDSWFSGYDFGVFAAIVSIVLGGMILLAVVVKVYNLIGG